MAVAVAVSCLSPHLMAEEIHDAAGAGDLDKIKEMILATPDLVNQREANTGNTPLHVAAALGQKEVVSFLLQHQADVTATNQLGLTAIRMAKLRGQNGAVNIMMQTELPKADRKVMLAVEILEMVRSGQVAELKELVLKYPEFDLANAADVRDNSVLHGASFAGNTELVAFLLENKANASLTNRDGATPLHGASFMGRTEIAKLLLARHVPVDIKTGAGVTPLILACDRGNREIVDLLLENKADINASSRVGITPLVAATAGGHREIVKSLIAAKANVNARMKDGTTALMLAEKRSLTEIIEMLKTAGAVGTAAPVATP